MWFEGGWRKGVRTGEVLPSHVAFSAVWEVVVIADLRGSVESCSAKLSRATASWRAVGAAIMLASMSSKAEPCLGDVELF